MNHSLFRGYHAPSLVFGSVIESSEGVVNLGRIPVQ
jgi:hypothetical protein